VCVTIVGTYFLLNAENYHWHWTAFSAGASTCEQAYERRAQGGEEWGSVAEMQAPLLIHMLFPVGWLHCSALC